MTEYNINYNTAANAPADPRRAVYPLRQTGYIEVVLGSGATAYVEPGFQSIAGNQISWLIPDRCELNAAISCSGVFGGGSLYVYCSVDGTTFLQTHILFFPGNTNLTLITGIELVGLAARFRLHSGVAANTIRCYINLRSV